MSIQHLLFCERRYWIIAIFFCFIITACEDTNDLSIAADAKADACVPNCKDKTCGPDGCDGICGVCRSFEHCRPGGQVCVNLGCWSDWWASACCVGEVLLKCVGGAWVEKDCSSNQHCGWNAGGNTYSCSTAGGEDPSGKRKKSCP